MTDFFIGGLIVGASATYLVIMIAIQWRRDRTPPTDSPTVTVVHTDAPIQPEDLAAIRLVLTAYYQAQLTAAYQQVLDQVAADETESGVDAIEDAANQRRAS